MRTIDLLRGRLLGPDGKPAVGAEIFYKRWFPTDAAGRFEAEILVEVYHGRGTSPTLTSPTLTTSAQPLIARRAGNFPPLVRDVVDLLSDDPSAPQQVEIVLGGPPLEIVGRVERADGSPAADWGITIANPGPGHPIDGRRVPLELAGSGEPPLSKAGQDGGFRLRGPFDRPYDVIAWDPSSLTHVVARDVRPEDGEHVLRAPDPFLARPAAGTAGERAARLPAGPCGDRACAARRDEGTEVDDLPRDVTGAPGRGHAAAQAAHPEAEVRAVPGLDRARGDPVHLGGVDAGVQRPAVGLIEELERVHGAVDPARVTAPAVVQIGDPTLRAGLDPGGSTREAARGGQGR